MKNFETLVNALTEAKVPCKVKLGTDGDIVVECGFDYPDSIFHKISDIASELNINVDICADSSFSVKSSKAIAGGPKRY